MAAPFEIGPTTPRLEGGPGRRGESARSPFGMGQFANAAPSVRQRRADGTTGRVILRGGKPPFRGVWTVDGRLDTSDPQRRVVLPGGDTELEILVTLHGMDDEFELQEYNDQGLVSTDRWNNGVAPGNAICNANGNTPGFRPLQ